MRRVHWLGALCMSLLLHVGIAGVMNQPQSIDGEARDDGEGGVEIGLGLAGTYSDAAPHSNPTAKQPKPPVLPKPASAPPKESKSLPSQAENNKPSPVEVEKAARAAARPPEPRIKPEEPKAATVPRQTQISPDRGAVSTTETTAADTSGAASQTTAPQQDSRPPQQKATGSGRSNSAGGRKGTAKSYFGDLMAWLNKHKRYPPELKKQKKQGVVTLRFTIDSTGRVLSSRIDKSSGTAQLDQGALAMLAAASPLPPIPEDMQRDTLSLVIPVEYSLITNRFD